MEQTRGVGRQMVQGGVGDAPQAWFHVGPEGQVVDPGACDKFDCQREATAAPGDVGDDVGRGPGIEPRRGQGHRFAGVAILVERQRPNREHAFAWDSERATRSRGRRVGGAGR